MPFIHLVENKILVDESFIKFYYILYFVYTRVKKLMMCYIIYWKTFLHGLKEQYVINKHKTQHERMNGGSYEVTTRGISS